LREIVPVVPDKNPHPTAQPLSGYMMTAVVMVTMLVAARGFFAVEGILFRALTALWFAIGALLLWLRWRPRN
jgi:hypothetical protein